MTPQDMGAVLVTLENYQKLWKLLEDMETLLWNIKSLNEDLAEAMNQRF
jgi:hypothetical protein